MSTMSETAARLALDIGPSIERHLTEAVLSVEPGRKPAEVVTALTELAAAWKRVLATTSPSNRGYELRDLGQFTKTVELIDARLKVLHTLHVEPTLPQAADR